MGLNDAVKKELVKRANEQMLEKLAEELRREILKKIAAEIVESPAKKSKAKGIGLGLLLGILGTGAGSYFLSQHPELVQQAVDKLDNLLPGRASQDQSAAAQPSTGSSEADFSIFTKQNGKVAPNLQIRIENETAAQPSNLTPNTVRSSSPIGTGETLAPETARDASFNLLNQRNQGERQL